MILIALRHWLRRLFCRHHKISVVGETHNSRLVYTCSHCGKTWIAWNE